MFKPYIFITTSVVILLFTTKAFSKTSSDEMYLPCYLGEDHAFEFIQELTEDDAFSFSLSNSSTKKEIENNEKWHKKLRDEAKKRTSPRACTTKEVVLAKEIEKKHFCSYGILKESHCDSEDSILELEKIENHRKLRFSCIPGRGWHRSYFRDKIKDGSIDDFELNDVVKKIEPYGRCSREDLTLVSKKLEQHFQENNLYSPLYQNFLDTFQPPPVRYDFTGEVNTILQQHISSLENFVISNETSENIFSIEGDNVTGSEIRIDGSELTSIETTHGDERWKLILIEPRFALVQIGTRIPIFTDFGPINKVLRRSVPEMIKNSLIASESFHSAKNDTINENQQGEPSVESLSSIKDSVGSGEDKSLYSAKNDTINENQQDESSVALVQSGTPPDEILEIDFDESKVIEEELEILRGDSKEIIILSSDDTNRMIINMHLSIIEEQLFHEARVRQNTFSQSSKEIIENSKCEIYTKYASLLDKDVEENRIISNLVTRDCSS